MSLSSRWTHHNLADISSKQIQKMRNQALKKASDGRTDSVHALAEIEDAAAFQRELIDRQHRGK